MQFRPSDRDRRREERRDVVNGFRAWLLQRPGYVIPSWAHHLTGVSKAAVSKAVGQGRVRVESFTFPSGYRITLVNLLDVARLDVYRRPWGEFDPECLYAKRQARRRRQKPAGDVGAGSGAPTRPNAPGGHGGPATPKTRPPPGTPGGGQ